IDGPALLHDIVDELKKDYPIDPHRVYLFGHSAGAVFALAMSMVESRYFAATAIHAGAFPPGMETVAPSTKRKIPIAIFSGTADPFFPIKQVRATRDVLKD